MVDSVDYNKETNEIVIIWNTAADSKKMSIDMKDIFNVALSGSEFISVKSEAGDKSYRVSIKTPELFKKIR